MATKAVLIFDDDCPLCLRFKQGVEHLDVKRSLDYVALSDSSFFKDHPEFSQVECQQKVHYRNAQGEIFSGPDVLPQLLLLLPGVEKFSWLLESDIGKKTVNFFYQQVESLRKKMKAQESCDQCPRDNDN